MISCLSLFGLAILSAVPTSSAQAPDALFVITSPSGGETWSAGSLHHVTWKSKGIPANTPLTIACSTDGGKSWVEVGKATLGAESFLWKVPATLSRDCLLRLSGPGGVMASCRAPFSIIASQEGKYRWVNVTKKAAFAPRDGAGALVFKGKMWLLGGWNPGDKKHFPRICNNEVWSSSDGATWALEKPNTFLDRTFDPQRDWEGRHTAGYVVFKDRMWIVGGDVNQGHYHDDVWNSADGKTWDLVNRGKKVPWGPR
ncbi:MAG TPA: hypothetical protein VFB21_04975, partial [Chthonomonadaceae bacterium]|nr:hypothetical protein [Chthonomonadaceae bacterium]